jgi:hydrogenase expression/formation protein HypC
MCVAVPGRILSISDDAVAEVDFGGTRREVSLALLDNPQPGEYVIVHAGFALHKVEAGEAEETVALFRKLLDGPTG